VLAQGVLVTVHDLYGGALPLRPMELYLRVRGYDVQPFRFQPRRQDLATAGKGAKVSDPVVAAQSHSFRMC
jgi:hypothetical protein